MLANSTLQRVDLVTRVISILVSGLAMILFAITTEKFFLVESAKQPWMSVLIVAAVRIIYTSTIQPSQHVFHELTMHKLFIAYAWNLLAIIATAFDIFRAPIQIVGDSVSLLVLSIMGGIGFAHVTQNNYYLAREFYTWEAWNTFHWIGGALTLIAM